jgi:hypothetical protein
MGKLRQGKTYLVWNSKLCNWNLVGFQIHDVSPTHGASLLCICFILFLLSPFKFVLHPYALFFAHTILTFFYIYENFFWESAKMVNYHFSKKFFFNVWSIVFIISGN